MDLANKLNSRSNGVEPDSPSAAAAEAAQQRGRNKISVTTGGVLPDNSVSFAQPRKPGEPEGMCRNLRMCPCRSSVFG